MFNRKHNLNVQSSESQFQHPVLNYDSKIKTIKIGLYNPGII